MRRWKEQRLPNDQQLGNDGRLRNDERGVAYTEFLIAFMPLLIFVLGITQLALIAQASLAVQHAANAAVRSAVVVLDDDPARYDGTPRRSLDQDGRGSGGSSGVLSFIGAPGGLPRRGDARTRDIRLAAYVPLLAIAPGRQQILSTRQRRTVQGAVGTADLGRSAFGLLYVLGSTGVVVGTGGRVRFGEGEDVTVRVTHAYPCLVPLAARVLCDSFIELQTGMPIATTQDLLERIRSGVNSAADLRAIAAAQERVRLQRGRLSDARPGVRDLRSAEVPELLWATVANGTRFRVITADATLPIHAAPYPYQSEVSR
jgi:hypothetical protein